MKKVTRLIFLLTLIIFLGNAAYAQNTECSGSATESTQGDPFTNGYKYTFTTSGTDVTIIFELLDTKVGLVAYIWDRTSGFTEYPMTNSTGQILTKTLSGETPGSPITIACKFAYSGGMAVTKDFTYTVGNDCSGGSSDTEAPTLFTATKGAVTSNTVELLLNATDNSGAVVYEITYGTTTLSTGGSSGVEKSYIVTGLTSSTDYSFSVTAKDVAGNAATNSPITIQATTSNLEVPTTAAPAPPAYNSPKVISIFSDAFSNVTATNYNPNWGQSTVVSTIQIESNNTLKYDNLNYQGTEFGSDVNAAPMQFLHIDVWTPDETSLSVFPISRASGEKSFALTPLNLNAWNSFDIPLTEFTSQGLSVADLFQFKFVGSGGKIVYLDNLYFYDTTATVDAESPTAFTATAGAITYSSIELLLNATDNSGAVNYEITYGTTTLTTGGQSGVQKSFVISGLSASTDYDFSVVAKDATRNAATNNPVTFSASTVAAPEVPIIGAPAPPAYNSPKVISIFSDAFTSITGNTNFNPNWGQNTRASTIQIDTNNALKYENLNYQGIEYGSDVNAANMQFLHVDVWTPNETSLNIYPISRSTGEKFVSLTPLNLKSWNSYDIPLTDFTSQGLSVNDLFQFKFVGAGGNIVYLDNLYFYDTTKTTDTEVPTDFTASKGAVTYNSVELLLKGTDNSGSIAYTITYGSTTLNTSGISGVQKSFIVTGLTSSTDYSFSAIAKDATGNEAANNPIIITATTAAGFAVPVTSATDPTVDTSLVISIFSDSYKSISGTTNFNPYWNQVTIESSFLIGNNNMLKYENFNYMGVEFGSDVNATTMKKLHLDVWTPNETSLKVYPISRSTAEKFVTLGQITLNSWNSFDIPLSDYTSQNLSISDVFQFKFVGTGSTIIYLDNIYFYTDVKNSIPTNSKANQLSCFPNPVVDQLTISSESLIKTVEIRNLTGQRLKFVNTNNNRTTIDLKDVSSGYYFILVKMVNGEISTRKIVKL